MRTNHRKTSSFCFACLLLSLLVVSPSSVLPNKNRSGTSITSPGDLRTRLLGGRSVAVSPPAPHVDMPQMLAATYYNLKSGLSGTLMLSNQGPHPMDVHVTLFSLAGAPLGAPVITLDGTEARGFDLRDWASTGGADFLEGSLRVDYDGKDMELGGVVKLVDADRSLIFDEELSEPMMFGSSRLEGVWWLPSHKSEMLLAVSNTSDASLSVSVNIDGVLPKQNGPTVLSLGPHESRAMQVQDFAGNGRGTLSKIGGISISHSGPPGALLARGLIQKPETGFSTVVEFSDPGMAKSSRLDGAGLRFGRVGGESLTSIAVARNVGDTPTTLRGRISFTRQDGTMGEVRLPPAQLTAQEAREIDLNGAIRSNGLDEDANAAGVDFEYTTAPGSVIISALNVSESGNQVFRVPMVDAAAVMSSTGTYPWEISADSSLFVYVKNASDRIQHYVLDIYYDGGGYGLAFQTLAPGETKVVDLRALRDKQIPDQRGRVIPLTANRGKVQWSVRAGDNRALIGRIEQADFVKGLSMTASCGDCCPSSFWACWMNPDSVAGVPGDSSDFQAIEQDVTCYGVPYEEYYWSGPYNYANWNSSDTSVATVVYPGTATAQNPGSATIEATWDAEIWRQVPPDLGFCERDPTTAIADAICDVLTRDLYFTEVSYFNLRAPFTDLGQKDEATLDLGRAIDSDRICSNPNATGSEFDITINFRFLIGATIDGRSSTRNKVITGKDHQFEWLAWDFNSIDSSAGTGSMFIKLFRKSPNLPLDYVDFVIAGNNPPGTIGSFAGHGKVHLHCP